MQRYIVIMIVMFRIEMDMVVVVKLIKLVVMFFGDCIGLYMCFVILYLVFFIGIFLQNISFGMRIMEVISVMIFRDIFFQYKVICFWNG